MPFSTLFDESKCDFDENTCWKWFFCFSLSSCSLPPIQKKPIPNQTGLEPMSLSTVNFRAFLRDSVWKVRTFLHLVPQKFIENWFAERCEAVLREQTVRRNREKRRSNIRYCESFWRGQIEWAKHVQFSQAVCLSKPRWFESRLVIYIILDLRTSCKSEIAEKNIFLISSFCPLFKTDFICYNKRWYEKMRKNEERTRGHGRK